jgi:hypothetical protein
MNLKKIIGSRPFRTAVLAFIYLGTLWASYWLGYQLRFDFAVPEEEWRKLEIHWPLVLALKLALLASFGQFSGLLSYFSLPDLRRLIYACTLGSMSLLGVRYLTSDFYVVSRGVILLDYFFSLAGLTTVRLGFRIYREHYLATQSRPTLRARRVGIIGAGDVGASLARELLTKRGLGMQPVAFFDDDPEKWRSRIHEIPVVGAPETLLDPPTRPLIPPTSWARLSGWRKSSSSHFMRISLGEHTRPRVYRSAPRRPMQQPQTQQTVASHRRNVAARRRKPHASRVRSPQNS